MTPTNLSSTPFVSWENALERINFLSDTEKSKLKSLYIGKKDSSDSTFQRKYPFRTRRIKDFCGSHFYSSFYAGFNDKGPIENWFNDLQDINCSDEKLIDFDTIEEGKPLLNESHVEDFIWLSELEKNELLSKYRRGDADCLAIAYKHGKSVAELYKSPKLSVIFETLQKYQPEMPQTSMGTKGLEMFFKFQGTPWTVSKKERKIDKKFQEEETYDFQRKTRTFEGYVKDLTQEHREKILFFFKRALGHDELISFYDSFSWVYKIQGRLTRDYYEKVRNQQQWDELNVNALLLKAGIENPLETNKCARVGLIRGNFGFEFSGNPEELNKQVGKTKSCYCCGDVRTTVKEALTNNAVDENVVYCDGEDSCEYYMTGMCSPRKKVRCKWQEEENNHCKLCPNLGDCFDPNVDHCFNNCGRHNYGQYERPRCECENFFDLQIDLLRGSRSALAYVYFFTLLHEESLQEPTEEEFNQGGF